jgi:hypothetical protein
MSIAPTGTREGGLSAWLGSEAPSPFLTLTKEGKLVDHLVALLATLAVLLGALTALILAGEKLLVAGEKLLVAGEKLLGTLARLRRKAPSPDADKGT